MSEIVFYICAGVSIMSLFAALYIFVRDVCEYWKGKREIARRKPQWDDGPSRTHKKD